MQRKVFVSFLVLALLIGITACSSQQSAPAQQAPAQQAPAQQQPAQQPAQQAPAQQQPAQAPAAKSAGTVEIEFWTLLTGNLAQELDNLINDFNKSQTEVKITNVNQGGYPQLQQKLLASIAAGNPPVATMVDYIYVPYYAQQGVFASLDEFMTAEDKKDFIPQLLTDLSYQGKVYALPFNRSTQGLYYNKDLFKEVGLSPDAGPKDWTEFREFSKKLTNADKKQYGAYATVPRWYWGPFVWSNGGEVSDENCNVKFQEQPGQETAQYLQDLVHKDKTNIIPANLSGTFDQQAVEFIQGKVGMMRQSTAIQSFIGNSVKFQWGFSGMPAGPKARVVSGGGGNVAITAKATPEQKQAAWKFLKFLTDTKQSARWHMATGYMPSRYSVLELPEVKEFHQKNPSYLLSVKQLDFLHATSCLEFNIPQYEGVIQPALERIIINNEPVDKTLNQAAADLTPLVKQAQAENRIIKQK